MFATRLEQVHRGKLYRSSFERRYQVTVDTDECLEEALANADAYRRVKTLCLRYDDAKLRAALNALEEYIRRSPPGYRMAMDYTTPTTFTRGRGEFAEANYRESFRSRPKCDPDVWKTFPHAFSPMSRVNSRVNYVVPPDSSIALRAGLGLRYLNYKQLSKRLRKLGDCKPTGKGKGSHEIWTCPGGGKFPIPKHPRDLPTGTLRSIIREAGLDLSVAQFVSAKV
jgi:predicted RNA binding protein YcfA (HicA-like mRNA interferase family)